MVDLQEIARYMRMGRTIPDGALAARVTELRDEALTIIRTAHIGRRFPIVEGNIVSGSVRLVLAGTLARHLAGCHAAYLVCGTIGAALEMFPLAFALHVADMEATYFLEGSVGASGK